MRKILFLREVRAGRRLPLILALVGCLALLAGDALLVRHAHKLQQQAQATAQAQRAAQAQPKAPAAAALNTTATAAPSSAPAPAAAPATAAPKAQPTAKPKTPAPTPQLSACDQNRSAFYVQHTAAISQEYKTHQQNLAELQQHYDAGDYDTFEDYQADVDDENARWQEADAAIDATYANQLRSVGCPVYL